MLGNSNNNSKTILTVGVLCWKPMVVGDSILFACFINFFKDLNNLLHQRYILTKNEAYNIEYKITFFIHKKNL